MSLKKTRFVKGIILAPDTASLDAIEGEIKVDSSDGKIKVTLGSAAREVVTNSQTQELTNKTLTSPVINTGVSGTAIDTDGTLAANSDTKLASQKAIKTYVDAAVASKDQASEISYDNTTSGLVATNVQAAIDEVEGRVQTAEGGLSGHITQATDAHDASAISVVPTGNLAADDVQEALVELQTDVDTRATNSALSTHAGTSSGVHGVIGSIVGTSDNQTLTTKTIDADNNTISNLETDNLKAGVLNTSTSLSGASNTQIPSALAVKSYVDALPDVIVASENQVTLLNGQINADITGLVIDGYSAVVVEYFIRRTTDDTYASQMGELRFVEDTTGWLLSDSYSGIDTGIEFRVDNLTGQVQYSSTDITSSNHFCIMKFKIVKTFAGV